MKNIFIFDMDGTLTPSRRKMTKDFEEFYTSREKLDMDTFENLGVIKNESKYDENQLNNFEDAINNIKNSSSWSKKSIVDEFFKMIPGFKYIDNGKYLNGKM